MTTVKQEVNHVTALVGAQAKDDSVRSSCGESKSEILRNRLLCNSTSGSSSCTSRPPEVVSVSTSSATVPVQSVIMSSSSGGGGSSSGGTAYPKCNISLTMSGNSEHLSVITTSIADAANRGIFPGSSNSSRSDHGGKLPEIDIKPVILGVGQCAPPPPVSTMSSSAISVTPMEQPVSVKTELAPGSVEIPYDRERIRNFLTDYWKSKNLQQVAEAQQQTAGVSGVSSADFCPAPQRIVEEALFDLFVEHPMMIDGLAIPKRAWAKAFYEKDVIQTSKVLFEALFSEQEMQQCTLNGKKGTPELSAVKMLAILRAAAWMKNKRQDPYSFNTDIPSHNQFPSNEEREKIEKKVFTERRSQANRKITKTNTGEGSSSPSAHDSETQSQDSPVGHSKNRSCSPPATSSPAGENRLSLSDDFRREHMAPLAKIPRLDLDTEVVKQLQMLYAENPEGLISYLLPEARAILVDGFLIPHEDWTKAFSEVGVDIVKAAWTLFKVLFSKTEILNCTLNGKNGTRELCPVKKLAILRAVTWMKDNQGAPIDIFKFNVRRTECNCFPSDEDKDKIETKVYTEKRYQACRKLKGQQV